MLKLKTDSLLALVEGDIKDMQRMRGISKSESVIGEVGGMVVTISIQTKEEADYTFSGDINDLKLLEEVYA